MRLPQLGKFHIHLYDVKDQLKQHVYNRSMEAFDEGDRARDALRSVKEAEARRSRMREALMEALGGLPSSDHALEPQITGKVQREGFRIEKVIFQSRPQTYVTANLYVPEGAGAGGAPRGAVLFLCGHHDDAKEAPEYQAVCQRLVHAGLVVLAMDPIGQGERLSYYEPSLHTEAVGCGTAEHDYAGTPSWLLGDSIARYFVHDAMRAVDYLITRPEVDPARIGVTGNSGGGTQTSLLMICDPRLAAAAPATFIMNRRAYLGSGQAQDAEQIWPGMTALGFDHEDILLAMAPRPVLVLAAAYDFFPVEGTRSTVRRAGRIWDLYGRGGHLQYFEEPVDHRFTPAMAKAAAAFFSVHLLGTPVAEEPREVRPLERSALWCTRRGQIREEKAGARAVQEENADRLRELENGMREVPEPERKERALSWLRARVFAGRSEPCELNPRYVSLGQMDELTVTSVVWWSRKDILNHGMLFRNDLDRDLELPLTVAVWDNGTRALEQHFAWVREQCRSGRAVLVLDVTAAGALTPNAVNAAEIRDSFGTIYKLTTDLFWLGDSLAAIRTYDVIRAHEWAGMLAGVHSRGVSLYASGKYGLYALLAAAIDPRVGSAGKEIRLGMKSMADWVRARYYDHYDSSGLILPGMLKYFDLPDLQRWVLDGS